MSWLANASNDLSCKVLLSKYCLPTHLVCNSMVNCLTGLYARVEAAIKFGENAMSVLFLVMASWLPVS